MLSRNKRHLLLQRFFWSPIGLKFVKFFESFERRFRYVVMNYSLHSDTNGEYWLIDQLKDDCCIFDVGFNDGDYSAQVVGRKPKCQIFAFDPARSKATIAKSRFGDRVRFFPIALSDCKAELDFFDYENECSSLIQRADGNRDGAAPISYKVPVRTLDDFVQEYGIRSIDLLKVDTEGFDLNVISGARKMYVDGQIRITMFEFASGWYSTKRNLLEVVEFLKEFPDYKLYRLFNGFLVPFVWSPRNENYAMGSMFVIKRNDVEVSIRDDITF